MALSIEIPVNVTITKAEIDLIKLHVVEKRNKAKCCVYAKMDGRTFDKMMLGEPVTEHQATKILEFAAHVANDNK